jgi:geranylgeranyl diphosphate synthase, type II
VTPGRSFEERLERYRRLATGGVMDYLPDKEPRDYLWDIAASYPLRPAKGLRPALCIATCRAFGGDIRSVVHCAVALELLHNAFLVHDDVEDGSQTRRGAPTLSAEHGVPLAVNAGDALNALALRVLMDGAAVLGPSATLGVFAEIERMVRESVEGQALELGWVRDNVDGLSEEDYMRMVLKKTCWYTTIAPCRIGAFVATAGALDLDVFNEFGFFMGAAFQIQDDLLKLEPDVREGKRTLMLVHAQRAASTRDRERLRDYLGSPPPRRTRREIRWVLDLIESTGAADAARTCAKELATAARSRFDAVYGPLPESEDKRLVGDLVAYVVERDV